jgi:nitrate reductase gamma subunit
MSTALHLARGPFLYLAFAVLLLGALRQWGLTISELVRAHRVAGDQRIPWRWMFRKSLGWIVPVNALRGMRIPFTAASAVFHVGMLLVPLFLEGHVALIRKGLGLSWPTLPSGAADVLTVAALAGLGVILLYRILDRAVRFLSGAQDYLLLALCMVVFVSGYLVGHPAGSPLPFEAVYLCHLLGAELVLVLIPFSKLCHALLFASTRIVWELGWHFVPGGGEKVRRALGRAGEPV